MTWTVIWQPRPLNDLASLWTDAASEERKNIALASNAIDHKLHVNPEDAGESRPLGRRILFHPPLGVFFEIREQDRMVVVTEVWRIPSRH